MAYNHLPPVRHRFSVDFCGGYSTTTEKKILEKAGLKFLKVYMIQYYLASLLVVKITT